MVSRVWSTVSKLFARQSPKRTQKEVEAELQAARRDHADAMMSKDAVLSEFRAFESRVAAQKQ